ncbi:hypothetical protein Scep_027409 [Stephania cephalantha]|uniref:Uncharacterized protein n=1 Tax=Stephania cephalantha TaxID=152367 RepID=A0AAP0EBC0_9MAGN
MRDGQWKEKTEEIDHIVEEHFQNLFTSTNPSEEAFVGTNLFGQKIQHENRGTKQILEARKRSLLNKISPYRSKQCMHNGINRN